MIDLNWRYLTDRELLGQKRKELRAVWRLRLQEQRDAVDALRLANLALVRARRDRDDATTLWKAAK